MMGLEMAMEAINDDGIDLAIVQKHLNSWPAATCSSVQEFFNKCIPVVHKGPTPAQPTPPPPAATGPSAVAEEVSALVDPLKAEVANLTATVTKLVKTVVKAPKAQVPPTPLVAPTPASTTPTPRQSFAGAVSQVASKPSPTVPKPCALCPPELIVPINGAPDWLDLVQPLHVVSAANAAISALPKSHSLAVAAYCCTKGDNVVLVGWPRVSDKHFTVLLGKINFAQVLADTVTHAGVTCPIPPKTGKTSANHTWSILRIDGVPTGCTITNKAMSRDTIKCLLINNHPNLANVQWARTPSWVKEPGLYLPCAVSSCQIAIVNPTGAIHNRLLALKKVFVLGAYAEIGWWTHNKPARKAKSNITLPTTATPGPSEPTATHGPSGPTATPGGAKCPAATTLLPESPHTVEASSSQPQTKKQRKAKK